MLPRGDRYTPPLHWEEIREASTNNRERERDRIHWYVGRDSVLGCLLVCQPVCVW